MTTEKIKIQIIKGMEAKEMQRIKLKAPMREEDLLEGRRLVATSGSIIETKEGAVCGDGDSVALNWEPDFG